MPNAYKKRYVVLSCFHTLSSLDRGKILCSRIRRKLNLVLLCLWEVHQVHQVEFKADMTASIWNKHVRWPILLRGVFDRRDRVFRNSPESLFYTFSHDYGISRLPLKPRHKRPRQRTTVCLKSGHKKPKHAQNKLHTFSHEYCNLSLPLKAFGLVVWWFWAVFV